MKSIVKEQLTILATAVAIIFIAFIFNNDKTPDKPQIVFQTETVSTTTLVEISRGNTSKNEVVFTFDGGGDIQSGDKILEVLAKHHVKGTFFLTGKMIETNPEFVKRIAMAGHEIFNHTYSHLNLTTLTEGGIGEELSKMEKTLQLVTGTSSKPYFRVPYGTRNPKVLATAASHGYQSVFWTVDARDWAESEGETPALVEGRILSSVAPGNIYLMHVGDTITGDILDNVFTTIESKGYRIVSLTQGL